MLQLLKALENGVRMCWVSFSRCKFDLCSTVRLR